MRIGVVFPQNEIGADAGAVRAYGQAVEELGFRHVLAFDHVVGADPAVHQGWQGPYDVRSTFHEPMVLFGYLAALTSLELVTGVIVLPQRQTVLVAKQAVTFGGAFHRVTGAGLAPLPVRRPIPVWFGGQSPPAYRRAGRLADGWFPQLSLGPELDEARAMVEEAATQAGRDPATLGMEGRASWTGDAGELTEAADALGLRAG
ncbi:LLM class flavin-dependent oxidoreductase [Nonomuraea sp. NPDC049714]|uniref:LLM class flavin-dependent oxidoreductase n=1 Tax=Nonomuraea sp. NPDC049714 TaxID=3364357 RepID=UPI0037B8F000